MFTTVLFCRTEPPIACVHRFGQGLGLLMLLALPLSASAQSPVQLDDRREPFLDSLFLDSLRGGAERRMHHPTPRGIVLRTDEPWEGNASAYFTIFRDGDQYRMYYRCAHRSGGDVDQELTCYAESNDGINWRKPDLGLVEFNGSKQNNIVWDRLGTHNFTPFKDPNPEARPDARYKAVASKKGSYPDGELYAFSSPDGIRWERMRQEPIITKGAFDSQNLVFWDSDRGQYRAYWRDFRDGTRDIRTANSEDFRHWSDSKWLKYPGAAERDLYTNQIMPHPRAPHVLIGFPARFVRRGGVPLTEGLLMSSRDRQTFHRWPEALIRPGPNQDKWQNRSNYIWWGLVETKSGAGEAPPKWSLYVNEGYREGDFTSIRRYTIRKDGFVSIHAPMSGGQLTSQPFTFEGTALTLNLATAAAGSVRVELQTRNGKPIDGHSFSDCDVTYGDALSKTVRWNGEADISDLAGRPIRLRIQLKDADLYSLKFR